MAIDWFRLSDDLHAEVNRLGFEWIDFSHSPSMRAPWLRLYVDRRETSLTIEDATFLTRVLVNWLQTQLPETVDFRLDVSSPGLDRPFTEPWQFTKQIEKYLQVTCRNTPNNRTETGVLIAVTEAGIQLQTQDGKTVDLGWKSIMEGKVVFPVQDKKMKSKGTRR